MVNNLGGLDLVGRNDPEPDGPCGDGSGDFGDFGALLVLLRGPALWDGELRLFRSLGS